MAIELINIGHSANDGTGDELRVAFQKINTNFDDLNTEIDELTARTVTLEARNSEFDNNIQDFFENINVNADTVDGKHASDFDVAGTAQQYFNNHLTNANPHDQYVQKIPGKSLSTNDYTNSDKNTLLTLDTSVNGIQTLISLGSTINNNVVELNEPASGDILFNSARIFEDGQSNVFFEVTCSVSNDGSRIEFDPADNLNGLYGVVSYLSYDKTAI